MPRWAQSRKIAFHSQKPAKTHQKARPRGDDPEAMTFQKSKPVQMKFACWRNPGNELSINAVGCQGHQTRDDLPKRARARGNQPGVVLRDSNGVTPFVKDDSNCKATEGSVNNTRLELGAWFGGLSKRIGSTANKLWNNPSNSTLCCSGSRLCTTARFELSIAVIEWAKGRSRI